MDPAFAEPDPRPLRDFRSRDAYVLLGDPGAGKTTAFEDEAAALETSALLISARDFLGLQAPWSVPDGKTLFIDGLDEVRAGELNARTPFDRIRRRLIELGMPRFRLSCREADWLGENDRNHLAKVAPDGQVVVLRIDPLTDGDIKVILENRPDICDVGEFVSRARNRGVDGLLPNPQTLNMLADVVGGGDEWPASRLETFERACLHIVREHNEEHRASRRLGEVPTPEQLLDAAGRLCAIHLLTGTEGFSILADADDVNYLNPDRCDYQAPAVLRNSLGTKLFTGHSESRLRPIHRHVAEYLAARHLARIVHEQKLPARRIIALIEGDDGTVVTEMRGLSAWLAAQCRAARPDLIDRDPIGVGQYGDVRGFTHREKRLLLQALEQRVPGQDLEFGLAASFRSLVTPDMECALKEALSGPGRAREQQSFIRFLLQVVIESGPLPGLAENLLAIIRDATWWPSVRAWSLDAFCSSGQAKPEVLRALLADVREGNVADPDDDLCGTLLEQLYPQQLSSAELWKHFARQQNSDRFGRYRLFWDVKLLERSPDAHVAEHLDHLSRTRTRSRHLLPVDGFRRLRRGLVARGLKLYGDKLVEERDIARLYDWLGVASGRDRDDLGGDWDGSLSAIRRWLEVRAGVQKALILEGLSRCPAGDGFRVCAFEVDNRLYRSARPSDFGLWCLDQAVAREGVARQATKHLLELALASLQDDRVNDGLSLERIEKRVEGNRVLHEYLMLLRSPWKKSREHLEWERKQREYLEERQRKRQQELKELRAQEDAFRENRAPPAWLHNLAMIYFCNFLDFNKDAGPRAIEKRLEGDSSLIQAVLTAFRLTVEREDVPILKDILALNKKGRMYYLGLPFLAGLAEMERTAPEESSEWDDDRARTALAFYYTTAHGDYQPGWYRRLVSERPEIVADVQVRVAAARFRADRLVDWDLWRLARDRSHAQVARHSALRLLRGFPTRGRLKLQTDLDQLLWAALQHAEREDLRSLIETKLSRSSLSQWQRAHWLAAGLLVSPNLFAPALRDHVRDRENQLSHLAAFLRPPDRASGLLDSLAPEYLALLIRLLGSSVGPERIAVSRRRATPVSSRMERSELVRDLIRRLALSSAPEASALLKSLATDDRVSGWNDELQRAREVQRISRRDEGFRHPGVDDVCGTLRGGRPANVADLAALVVDCLEGLAVEINQGDADGWEPFWNQDGDGHRTKPKRENSCRNVIAKELKLRLPSSVETSMEAHHARENRSDLRASFLTPAGERFHVPVEIKKNDHRDLWTAIDSQLIGKYTIDPEAGGYGIYLVLWFGREYTRRSPHGDRPDSLEELEDRLRDALPVSQARKISICVIDVSGAAPAGSGSS